MVKKIFYTTGAIIILIVITLVVIWYFLFAGPSQFVVSEPRLGINGAAIVRMEQGMTIPQFAQELENQKVIKSASIFLSLVQKFHLEKKIKVGIYVFTEKTHVFGIIERVSSGDYGYTPVKITIPEGYTTFMIASTTPSKLVDITSADFLNAAKDLEGYLFPDTYFLYPYATSSDLIKLMQDNFLRKIKPLNAEINASGHTLQEIITMASILEKEVQTPEDKAKVSDLFWRRIENGMPLQADSTLTYVTGRGSDELTIKDLQEHSPYNSYTNKGLPPTPITNPGIVSIQAAINPAKNEYVFFLSDKDGKTHFSKTYREHLLLKKKYLP